MNRAAIVVVLVALYGGVAQAQPPWIGINLTAGSFGGAKVKSVVPGSPGERAGIHPGDEVLSLDDHPTETPDAVIKNVLHAGVGARVRMRLVDAKGHTRAVSLQLEERPDREALQHQALVGRPAPDFLPVVQTGGKLPRISGLRGNVVVIDFFATWCGPCIAAMPHLEEIHQALKSKGVVVLGVSSEAAPVVARAAERFHLSYPLASDEREDVSGTYQVFALPTMVVIDRKGLVREVAVADTDAVDNAIEAALKR